MGLQECSGLGVGTPDRTQAGSLGGHDVHTIAVIGRHGGNARTHKFHDLVLDIAVFEHCTDDCERDVLRADIRLGLSVQIDGNHAGIGHIVGISQELFDQLAAPLSDGHGAQGTIAGVGI